MSLALPTKIGLGCFIWYTHSLPHTILRQIKCVSAGNIRTYQLCFPLDCLVYSFQKKMLTLWGHSSKKISFFDILFCFFFFFCYPELQFHYLSGSHHNANFQVVSVNKHFWSASGAFCGWHLGVTDVKTPNPQGVCNIFTIKPLDAYKISCKPFKMLFFPLNLHKHNVRV